MNRITAIIAALLVAATIAARRYTISGYITEDKSNESLISATVYDSLSSAGCLTNEHGFYSLSLDEGSVALRFSYVGCATQRTAFELTADTVLNIQLTPHLQLAEVEVRGQRSQFGVEGTQMSAIALPVDFIKKLPTFAGEVDIVKAIQLMPGVQAGNEGTSGLYVRGGGADECLILLDGVPLYNVNHMMGIFSAFNADAIKNVTFHKGNFPARYGSRLSGVLDVRQKDGDARNFHGSATIGTLTAKVNLEGPIWKDHTTFNISARRTYFDALMPLIMGVGGSVGSGDKHTVGYSFWDVNARISHRFSDSDRLTASFYMGDDAYYNHYSWKSFSTPDNSKRRSSISWGNILASLNWNHLFSPVLFANTTVSYTRYHYRTANSERRLDTQRDSLGTIHNQIEYRENYNSYLDDISAQYTLNYTPTPRHNIRFGAIYTYHGFMPTTESFHREHQKKIYDAGVDMDSVLEDPLDKQLYYDSVNGTTHISAHEAAVFAEDDWSIHRKFNLNYGLRASLYNVGKRTYWSIEPRVSLRWLIVDNFSFKASYAYTSQQIHMLTTQNEALPIDIYVPSTATVAPMTGHQAAAGLYYNLLDMVDFSVEGYCRTMNNIIDYRDEANFTSTTVPDWSEHVCVGRGWAYGIEFLAQRTVGKITGLVAYTWSKAFRKFDRPGQEINFGHTFYAPNDRRHDFTISLNYRPIPLIDFGATFIYATGQMTTLATQRLPDHSPWITERYNYRMPDYNRLDLNCNFHFRRPKGRYGEHLLSISVYNVYNQVNPMYMESRTDGAGELHLYKVSLFPVIPSLSYTFRF